MRSHIAIPGHGGRAGTGLRPLGSLVVFLTVFTATALRPAPASAQASFVVAGHVGSSTIAPGGAMLDVGTELRQGLWGLRLGVGLDASETPLAPLAPTASSSGAWSSDVDMGLNLGAVSFLETLLDRTDPTVFLGAGVAGVSITDDESSSSFVPTWSYGARGGLPVNRWLGVELEARHRAPVGSVDRAEYPSAGGWEYRAGLALRFGGGPAARVRSVPRRETTTAPRRPVSAPRTVSTASAPVSTEVEPTPVDAAALIAASALRTADQHVGTRYRWGGGSPTEGFDCSGFVRFVFGQHGIELPRISRDQARAGRAMPTSLDGLAPGDLLFFAQRSATVDHVAIYAGDGRIVHASRSGYGVRYDELTGDRGRWYAERLVAVRRVIDGDALAARAAAAAEMREMPLDDAFETLESEAGDGAAPPPQTR